MIRFPPPNDSGVDVCIVTFNHANYISDCLESIFSQTVKNPIRVWIHDDCSTDDTVEIARSCSVGRDVTIFSTSENLYTRSLYDLNQSINNNFSKFVMGSYICFIDGDDYWGDETKLEQQISFLVKNRGFSAAFHGVNMVDNQGDFIKEWIPQLFRRDYSADDLAAFNYAYIHNSAVLFRNCSAIVSPEALLAANGDMFAPHLFGAGGAIKFLSGIRPSCYRQTYKGTWTSKSEYEKAKAKVHFASLMVARLMSIGNISGALAQVSSRLLPAAHSVAEYLASEKAGRR